MKENTVVDNEYQGKEIRLCEDGKYRWVYELPILRNPTIFLTVFKVMVLVVGVVWLFMVLIFAFQGDLNKEMFMFTLKMLGIMMAIFMGLMIISILVLAAIYGGRYVFLFEMDENGVTQNLMPRQYKKAQAIALITTIVGLLAKNPTTVGAGLISARSSSTSEFAYVRRVKPHRWRHTINVNQLLNKNQVYVSDEDFDFVYNYIKSRCVRAK